MGAVAVIGSFMMDLVVRAPRRPRAGETVVGTDFYTSEGGKGFNQAVASARAGASTAMIGALGDDAYGRAFREFLSQEGIDFRGVSASEKGTGVGLPVVEDDGGNSIVVVKRANEDLTPAMVCEALDSLEDVSVVVAQLELAVDNAVAAAKWARERGVIFVLNPAPMSELPMELIESTDVLTPNEVELAELSRQVLGRVGTAEEDASKLAEKYGLTVVATLGAAGAMVVRPGMSPFHIPAPAVVAVDTVGAGDTFCGYLAAGLAQGANVMSVAPAACAAASLSVTRPGSAVSVPYLHELPMSATSSGRAFSEGDGVLDTQERKHDEEAQ